MRFAGKADVLYIADHSDDFRRRGHSAQPNVLANGVLFSKEFSRKTLVNDEDARGVSPVVLVEEAAPDERQFHNPQIGRRKCLDDQYGSLGQRQGGLSFHQHGREPRHVDGQRGGDGRRFHARENFDAADNLIVEVDHLIWFRISGRRQNDVHREHTVRLKAKWLSCEKGKTSN